MGIQLTYHAIQECTYDGEAANFLNIRWVMNNNGMLLSLICSEYGISVWGHFFWAFSAYLSTLVGVFSHIGRCC